MRRHEERDHHHHNDPSPGTELTSAKETDPQIKTETNVEMEGSSNSEFIGVGPEVNVFLIKEEDESLEIELEEETAKKELDVTWDLNWKFRVILHRLKSTAV